MDQQFYRFLSKINNDNLKEEKMNKLYQKILNDKDYQTLIEIKKRPGLYLRSGKSFRDLVNFMCGYDICKYDYNIEEEINVFNLKNDAGFKFNDFVRDKYNIKNMERDWKYGIESNSTDDMEAFDLFYNLLDEYIKMSIDNTDK